MEVEFEILGSPPGNGLVRYFYPDDCGDPLLVRFAVPKGISWVGGFGGGTFSARAGSGLFVVPSSNTVVVLSRGRAYAVHPDKPEATRILMAELAMQAYAAFEARLLLIADPWEVVAFDGEKTVWSSGRIAREGVEIIRADGKEVLVQLEEDDERALVSLDVHSGKIVG